MTRRIEIAELCKAVYCVDLGESFQTHIDSQNLASIQLRSGLAASQPAENEPFQVCPLFASPDPPKVQKMREDANLEAVQIKRSKDHGDQLIAAKQRLDMALDTVLPLVE